jgi:hypothetical protein
MIILAGKDWKANDKPCFEEWVAFLFEKGGYLSI